MAIGLEKGKESRCHIVCYLWYQNTLLMEMDRESIEQQRRVYHQANLSQKSPVCPTPAVRTSGLTLQTFSFLVNQIGLIIIYLPGKLLVLNNRTYNSAGILGLLNNWLFRIAMACLQPYNHFRG